MTDHVSTCMLNKLPEIGIKCPGSCVGELQYICDGWYLGDLSTMWNVVRDEGDETGLARYIKYGDVFPSRAMGLRHVPEIDGKPLYHARYTWLPHDSQDPPFASLEGWFEEPMDAAMAIMSRWAAYEKGVWDGKRGAFA